jgi:multiple sugar transport system permease protein
MGNIPPPNLVANNVATKKSKSKILANSPVPWILPLGIILALVFVYPIFEVIRLSFTNASLMENGYSYTFKSYSNLFTTPGFGKMLWVTTLFVFFSVTFQMIFGFFIALLIDQGTKRKLFGTVIARTAVLTAWAIPGVIIGVIWKLLYNESKAGILNNLLTVMGFKAIPFLSSPSIALISVIFSNVWRGTAFSMILIYAALQTFPNDVLEAAKIDGTNVWQRLFRVVVPIISPILLINLILISVQTFNTFDMVMALTGGGPGQSTDVIALNIYNTIFTGSNLGQGAANAVVLLCLNAVMTIVYFWFMGRQEGNR